MKLSRCMTLLLLAGYLSLCLSSGCNRQPTPVRKVYNISGTVTREKIESDGFYSFSAKTEYGDRIFFYKGDGYELDKKLNPDYSFSARVSHQDPKITKELLIGPDDITKINKPHQK